MCTSRYLACHKPIGLLLMSLFAQFQNWLRTLNVEKKARKLRYLREFNGVISQTNGKPVRFPRGRLYLQDVPTRLCAYSTACFLF